MRIDWEGLIRGQETGSTLRVHGVRVGDEATAIPRAVVTAADACWVRADGVAWAVEGGRIAKAFVRGAPLGGLRIEREADIERLFGHAEGMERKLGWVVHHYPARALAVAWSAREGRLEHVALGQLGWAEPVLTAKDLLSLVREIEAMVPDASAWSAEALKENPPRYYRFLRMQALMRALDLPPDLGPFIAGDFVSTRPEGAHDAFVERALAFLDERGLRPRAGDGRARFDVQHCFQYVYRFSRKLREVLTFNDGWLEAGTACAQFMIGFTRSCIPADMKASADRVDELLAAIVDPRGRAIPESRLVAEFGYPAVDLDDIDSDWA